MARTVGFQQRGQANMVGVKVIGLEETMAALKAFEPAVLKDLNKEINRQLKRVARGASGRSGASYRTSRRMRSTRKNQAGGSVFTALSPAHRKVWSDESGHLFPDVRAVIGEFAGTRGRGKTNQAQGFIKHMDTFGKPGRFLWAEWDSGTGKDVVDETEKAVRDAERKLQARLDSFGEAY